MLCALCEFEEAPSFTDEDLIENIMYEVENSNDKLSINITFYT